jgi:hypothetical protein
MSKLALHPLKKDARLTEQRIVFYNIKKRLMCNVPAINETSLETCGSTFGSL